MSGSSARKLKRAGANMLGGRALLRYMHPFTVLEIERDNTEKAFPLEQALIWGTLPPLLDLKSRDRAEILRTYVEVYLREEIQQEALVRNLGGFTRFLDITAAYSGEIVNYTSLGKEAGLPTRTVQSYFEVLEDTLILLRLPAWRKSPTKRLLSHPKMYLFDNGVANALCRRLRSPVDPTLKGRLFEQFMIQETRRRLDYSGLDYALYYWRTNNRAEVDLLIELDGQLKAAVEFKSRESVSKTDITGLASFHEDNPEVDCRIVSMAQEAFTIDFVKVLPWRKYLDLLNELK
jgi:predicted AAA+ superfamily ATPase